MSDSKNVRAIPPDDIEEKAAIWIDRRDRSSWSVQDQADLDAWLAQSMVHSIAFWRLNAAWRRTERLAALKPASQRTAVLLKRAWKISGPIRTAAVLAVTALIGISAFNLMQSDQHNYSTTIGGHEILTLSDGSSIELNTDTAVRVSDNFPGRRVWLDKGEAYFQIKHDSAHPFTVVAANHLVTDLGTKFVVRRNVGKIEVALSEGSAKLESDGTLRVQQAVTLKPGDVAVATESSLSVTQKSKRTLDRELSWRHGVLTFSGTTLSEATKQFNRYSRRKLVVVGSAARLKIDGTFASNDVAAFAAVSTHILHLRADEVGDEIVISR